MSGLHPRGLRFREMQQVLKVLSITSIMPLQQPHNRKSDVTRKNVAVCVRSCARAEKKRRPTSPLFLIAACVDAASAARTRIQFEQRHAEHRSRYSI